MGNFDQLVSEFGSDISVVADLSDFSDRSSDPEISKADYWKCVRCGTTNKNPCFRLCIRCFRVCFLYFVLLSQSCTSVGLVFF